MRQPDRAGGSKRFGASFIHSTHGCLNCGCQLNSFTAASTTEAMSTAICVEQDSPAPTPCGEW
jgi:hypothetical protein